MNLIVDIGNTAVKCAVMRGGEILSTFRADDPTPDLLGKILRKYRAVESAIVVSTRGDVGAAGEWLRGGVKRYIRMGPDTPAPIKNLYGTPRTLGYDRLAGAVGAAARYPGRNVLVVDFGTALTIDVVTAAGEFLGGSISPGAAMRLRALHTQTDGLPLVALDGGVGAPTTSAAAPAVAGCAGRPASRGLTAASTLAGPACAPAPASEVPAIGRTTTEAIRAGVVNGVVYEIEGYVARMKERYGQLDIIFTGGDADFFVKRLKFPIFVSYNLVFEGLNAILEYNKAL